jgi:predicted oxidoreductase
MWRFKGNDVDGGQRLAEAAIASGLTLFDTADVYGPDNGESFGAAESLFGQVLQQAPSLRGQICLSSKGGIIPGVPYDSSARYLIEACEASLRRLQTDRIDLYQIHRPDFLAHPHETAQALATLRQAGKIAEAGVSNYTCAQVSALQAHLPFRLVSIQIELSVLCTGALDDGRLDQAMQEDMAVLAWSPLGGGRVSGGPPAIATLTDALDACAAVYGVSREVVAYAWIANHPARPIPLVGSQQGGRITEAAGATAVQLSRRDWYGILEASRGAPMP